MRDYTRQNVTATVVELTSGAFLQLETPVLGDLQPGQRVLDLGCGAGMDSILAARRVAPGGTVIGVDMVEEMLAKARCNTEALGLYNLHYQPS